MTASEIAEALLNGNIAQARQEILAPGVHHRSGYTAAALALDVVIELAPMAPESVNYPEAWALGKVRRCLEGAP